MHNAAKALIPALTALGSSLAAQLPPTVEQFFELAESASKLEHAGRLIRTT
jgi:hypothetical protein